MRTSDLLTVGETYTRKALAERFNITDATRFNGIFRPKVHDSIWLFVTEKKSLDRTQYVDKLDGDILRWQGQTMGRSDASVINHATDGREVVVFYREDRKAYPDHGFRFEGPFRYVSHTGAGPASYVLERERPYSADPPADSSEVAAARALIDEQAGRARGQGFRVSSQTRRAIEEHAVGLAIAHFADDKVEGGGWDVENVGATRSYDLHCTRGDAELRVEVKGTTSDGSDVLLTPNEVAHARDHYPRVALFVVSRITLTDLNDGTVAPSGGNVRVVWPWRIDDGALSPVGYAYAVPYEGHLELAAQGGDGHRR